MDGRDELVGRLFTWETQMRDLHDVVEECVRAGYEIEFRPPMMTDDEEIAGKRVLMMVYVRKSSFTSARRVRQDSMNALAETAYEAFSEVHTTIQSLQSKRQKTPEADNK